MPMETWSVTLNGQPILAGDLVVLTSPGAVSVEFGDEPCERIADGAFVRRAAEHPPIADVLFREK